MNKYLIVGLGNPGKEYDHTRHNIGFDVVDEWVRSQGAEGYELQKLASVCHVKFKGRPTTVIKPSTYMNLSGKAVKYYLDKESIKIENLLVVVDDLALDLAKIRFRAKGSAGGHNGLQDIQEKIGTSVYPRMKIGIGDDFPKGRQVDYVLGKWSKSELDTLVHNTSRFVDAIDTFIFRGIRETMNHFNT